MVSVKDDGSELEPQLAINNMLGIRAGAITFTPLILRKHFDRGSNCGFDYGSNVEYGVGEFFCCIF